MTAFLGKRRARPPWRIPLFWCPVCEAWGRRHYHVTIDLHPLPHFTIIKGRRG